MQRGRTHWLVSDGSPYEPLPPCSRAWPPYGRPEWTETTKSPRASTSTPSATATPTRSGSSCNTSARLIKVIAAAHTRDAHDREELFQEITVRLWERRAQYSARGELGGWINRIAHRFCHDRGKARLARKTAAERHATEVLALADTGAVLEDPSILMDRKDFMDDLRLALAQLPEKQEETFTLIHIKGYGTAEVARMLGTRRATVRSNLRHAIRKLRELMKEYRV